MVFSGTLWNPTQQKGSDVPFEQSLLRASGMRLLDYSKNQFWIAISEIIPKTSFEWPYQWLFQKPVLNGHIRDYSKNQFWMAISDCADGHAGFQGNFRKYPGPHHCVICTFSFCVVHKKITITPVFYPYYLPMAQCTLLTVMECTRCSQSYLLSVLLFFLYFTYYGDTHWIYLCTRRPPRSNWFD